MDNAGAVHPTGTSHELSAGPSKPAEKIMKASSCCSSEEQANCCKPSDKGACCTKKQSGGCGCR